MSEYVRGFNDAYRVCTVKPKSEDRYWRLLDQIAAPGGMTPAALDEVYNYALGVAARTGSANDHTLAAFLDAVRLALVDRDQDDKEEIERLLDQVDDLEREVAELESRLDAKLDEVGQ